MVIKIARIYFFKAVHTFLYFLFNYGINKKLGIKYHFKNYTYEQYGTIQRLLFSGIMTNFYENKIYKRTKSKFLMPTYFSFFGLINIQKAGFKTSIKKPENLWCQFFYITKTNLWKYGFNKHHFANPDNFCKLNKKLVVVDYGDKRNYHFILKFGEKIYNEFDFNFDWEKEKNKL